LNFQITKIIIITLQIDMLWITVGFFFYIINMNNKKELSLYILCK